MYMNFNWTIEHFYITINDVLFMRLALLLRLMKMCKDELFNVQLCIWFVCRP
jgi:hypothetical protein